MSNSKRELSNYLRRIINAVDNLSEDEFSKLIDESYLIEIRVTRKRNKEENPVSVLEPDLSDLISKLTNFASREEAQRFLDSNCTTRKALEPIARNLDIPILKQDKVDVLRDKIIEATAGARIRSQAIQGNSA